MPGQYTMLSNVASPSRKSLRPLRPAALVRPSDSATRGRCRSRSTRNTQVLTSCASAIARLIAVSVLPSPAVMPVTAKECH